MNKEKTPTSEKNSIIGPRLRNAYFHRILGLFGFEIVRFKTYDNACCEEYWEHLESGWWFSVFYGDGGLCIRNGGDTPIPKDADFARHLTAEGLYKWSDDDLIVNEECSLEEIMGIVLHYLPDQEVMSILRSAIAWERDWADSEMARALFDEAMAGT